VLPFRRQLSSSPTPVSSAWLVALLLVAFTACAGGGNHPQSTLDPRSDFAADLSVLYKNIFAWAVGVFVVVEGLLLFVIIRFRAREGAPPPPRTHGNTVLEIAWTLAPALILVMIAVPTIRTVFKVAGDAPAGALRVEVVGHQWWWEYRYPDLGVVTANELHVPVGRPIAVSITSADVIHSWWAPRLGGKRDAIPNHINHIAFVADSVGTYLGQCVEFCGASHANMHLRVMVDSAATFEAWVAAQRDTTSRRPAAGSVEAAGQQAFLKYGCIGCHTIRGVSVGIIGPNLTHVGSRTTIAGGTMMNTQDHLRAWIGNPPGMKPGSLMPAMHVSDADLPALVAYLQSLK